MSKKHLRRNAAINVFVRSQVKVPKTTAKDDGVLSEEKVKDFIHKSTVFRKDGAVHQVRSGDGARQGPRGMISFKMGVVVSRVVLELEPAEAAAMELALTRILQGYYPSTDDVAVLSRTRKVLKDLAA
jgi:hypothetical protein